MHLKREGKLRNYLLSLSCFLSSLHRYLNQQALLPLDVPAHDFHPINVVYIQTWKDEPAKEKWTGPFLVFLITYTVMKVEEVTSWIHYTRVKKVFPEEQETSVPTGDFKLKISRNNLRHGTVPGVQKIHMWNQTALKDC